MIGVHLAACWQLAVLWAAVLAAGGAVQRVKLGVDTVDFASIVPAFALKPAGLLPHHPQTHQRDGLIFKFPSACRPPPASFPPAPGRVVGRRVFLPPPLLPYLISNLRAATHKSISATSPHPTRPQAAPGQV